MWCISVKIMVISVRQKNVIYFQLFLKMRKFLLNVKKYFLIMSNYYLVEILSEANNLTIVTSKKLLKMSNCVLILRIFFLKMRIRNLQCSNIFDVSPVLSAINKLIYHIFLLVRFLAPSWNSIPRNTQFSCLVCYFTLPNLFVFNHYFQFQFSAIFAQFNS